MSHMFKRGRAFVLGASVAFLIGPASAEPAYQLAQLYPAYPVYPAPPPPPPMFRWHHAEAVVRSLGLTPIGPVQPSGPVFVVPAAGREGTEVQVMIDRRTGRVLRITRIGPDAPRFVTRPPVPDYELDDEDDYAALDDDEARPRVAPGYRGPNVIARDPDITNSIPRSTSRPVDPLARVPKEFRGRSPSGDEPQRLAARPPADTVPLTAPLPRPRPADAPAVAQNPTPPATATVPAHAPKPDAKVPDAQGFD